MTPAEYSLAAYRLKVKNGATVENLYEATYGRPFQLTVCLENEPKNAVH